MPNSYFQFKQFRIDQGDAAMKVTTEGCLLGAWAAATARVPRSILDIGTGTGLLSLMLAQQFGSAQVDAVEIDESAYNQAMANFAASPWAGRLSVAGEPVQVFESDRKYDLIISNPPFFHNSLKATSGPANQARHSDSLDTEGLLGAIARWLTDEGQAFVLYPEREMRQFTRAAPAHGLHVAARLRVFNTEGGPVFREIACLTRNRQQLMEEELVIKAADGSYTPGFGRLLRPYYLHL